MRNPPAARGRGEGARDRAPGGSIARAGLAPLLLAQAAVNRDELIDVREVRSGGRRVVVQLFRNEGGSVAARCVLGEADMPIIDGRSAEEALATVEDAIEGVLLARAATGR